MEKKRPEVDEKLELLPEDFMNNIASCLGHLAGMFIGFSRGENCVYDMESEIGDYRGRVSMSVQADMKLIFSVMIYDDGGDLYFGHVDFVLDHKGRSLYLKSSGLKESQKEQFREKFKTMMRFCFHILPPAFGGVVKVGGEKLVVVPSVIPDAHEARQVWSSQSLLGPSIWSSVQYRNDQV